MKNRLIILTVAALIILAFSSTALASSYSGIVPVTAYYQGSSKPAPGKWTFSESSSGNIFITSGKKAKNPFEIKLPKIEFDFPEMSLSFSQTSPPKKPAIELTNLPGPNWSPSFKAAD